MDELLVHSVQNCLFCCPCACLYCPPFFLYQPFQFVYLHVYLPSYMTLSTCLPAPQAACFLIFLFDRSSFRPLPIIICLFGVRVFTNIFIFNPSSVGVQSACLHICLHACLPRWMNGVKKSIHSSFSPIKKKMVGPEKASKNRKT